MVGQRLRKRADSPIKFMYYQDVTDPVSSRWYQYSEGGALHHQPKCTFVPISFAKHITSSTSSWAEIPRGVHHLEPEDQIYQPAKLYPPIKISERGILRHLLLALAFLSITMRR